MKRAVCRHFQRRGCKFGLACRFAHPREKCLHVDRPGGCRRGDRCNFSHFFERSELEQSLASQKEAQLEYQRCSAFYGQDRNFYALAHHLDESAALPRDVLRLVRDYVCDPPLFPDTTLQQWYSFRVAPRVGSRQEAPSLACRRCGEPEGSVYALSGDRAMQLCSSCLVACGLTTHDVAWCSSGPYARATCDWCLQARVLRLEPLPTQGHGSTLPRVTPAALFHQLFLCLPESDQ